MAEALAGALGFVANLFTVNSSVYTPLVGFGEEKCPESLLD